MNFKNLLVFAALTVFLISSAALAFDINDPNNPMLARNAVFSASDTLRASGTSGEQKLSSVQITKFKHNVNFKVTVVGENNPGHAWVGCWGDIMHYGDVYKHFDFGLLKGLNETNSIQIDLNPTASYTPYQVVSGLYAARVWFRWQCNPYTPSLDDATVRLDMNVF